MKKVLLILLVTQTAFANPSVGLKNRVSERTHSILSGVFTLGNLGFNIMSAYFQTEQIGFLNKITYPDNEVGVPEEEKTCGRICQENSAQMRSNAKHSSNLDMVATVTAATGALFSTISLAIWAAMQANWDRHEEYTTNVNKFARIGLGASVVTAFLQVASTSLVVDSAIWHIGELPLRTLAPFQVAALTAAGYWLPMVLFGGYGLVKASESIEAGRVCLGRYTQLRNNEPIAMTEVVTQ